MFVFNQFIWNGRDEEGDKIANGVYIYKVKADFNGEIVTKIGKLIVMR
jgi:flagellar hook assembly protein FlgD